MAHILIIDDDRLFRTMLAETLTHFGHTVMQAANGKEGLKLAAGVKPQLLITDLVMPEMEGFELLMALQKHCLGVKIMVISGGGRGTVGSPVDYLEIAKNFGASKVLAKPFSSDTLLAAINELLPGGGA
jgi:DNA-binding response OmpR family regulator